MTTFTQLLAADWRIRLLAQLTCAPRPFPRTISDPRSKPEARS